jgi:hypothetical protein
MVIQASALHASPEETRLRGTLASILPRFIRLRDAPSYLGMDKNRFNREVRPLLSAIPIGTQRQDLRGHRSRRITTHYSQAELTNLMEAADKVCDTESRKCPATTWLRRKAN